MNHIVYRCIDLQAAVTYSHNTEVMKRDSKKLFLKKEPRKVMTNTLVKIYIVMLLTVQYPSFLTNSNLI